MNKSIKVSLPIKTKDYVRYITGDYYYPVKGTLETPDIESYIDNIKIQQFHNSIDEQASILLELLIEIEPELEKTLSLLLLEQAEKIID